MPTKPYTLIKGDRISNKTDYRDNLPVNMYAVQREILGANGYMIAYPGLTKFGDVNGIDRGANYNERFVNQFRVSGGQLLEVGINGLSSNLGAVSGTNQAAMPYSFNTQAVITNGNYYLYDPTNGFRQVSDPDLGDPIDCVWIDGYYFFTDGEYLFHTEIIDDEPFEESIDPLQFATAEFMPDPSLGLSKTQDNKIIVWGRYSAEYFVNVATENFAFQRVATRAQKIGIVATHAKCESDGKYYITGGRKDDSLSVHIITVGAAQKISTREIDKILEQYTEPELSDMRMESRMDGDIFFILIHLPGEVLCFNATIAKTFGVNVAWSVLKTDVLGDNPYRGINGIFDARIGEWIYGDKRASIIGQLDNSVCTHYEDIVEWLLYSPFINLETMSIDELEIETIPGHTTTADATVAISTTTNGVTYSKEWFALYGTPLDYGKRFFVRRVGYVDDWIGFKFRGASKSRMAFALMKLTYS